MRIFKAKGFGPGKDGPGDAELWEAVKEIEAGLVDAHLGGELVKKRIAGKGRGKSGGFRTVVAVRSGQKAFFLYCFAKKERDNIIGRELSALKKLASEYMACSEGDLDKALQSGALVEIDENGNET